MSFLPSAQTSRSFSRRVYRGAAAAAPLLAFLFCSACATSGHFEAEDDPPLETVPDVAPKAEVLPMAAGEARAEGDFEVPAVVAESEHRETPPSAEGIPELVVEGRERHLVIRDLVAEGQAQLRDVELQYAFIGKDGHDVLRGRPVAFALWSESQKSWTIAELEIPRPPIKWALLSFKWVEGHGG